MNTKRKTAVTLLLLAVLAGSAQADGRHRHDRGWNDHYRPAPARLHGADWIAPLVVLGIAGAAVSAIVNAPAPVTVQPPQPPQPPQPVAVYSPPQTVYTQPQRAAPVVVYSVSAAPTYALPPQVDASEPAGVAYYCPAYGQYHPRIQSCPSGWQLVALPR